MKIVKIILILALAFVPAILIIQKVSTVGVGLVIIAIIVALFFSNLDKFETFKFISKLFTLEAGLRQAISETYAALEQLKELALALSEPMIASLTMSGQMLRRLKLEYKLENVEEIADTLRKLGASDEEINHACGFIYRRVAIILIRVILDNIKPENWESSDIYKDFANWDLSEWDKTRIERFAAENSLMFTPEAKEWMADLDYFMQKKKLRRPDKWNDGLQM